jgi:hypothetical protein
MTWQLIAYALACVIVPVAWGLIVVWASNRMDQRIVRRGANAASGKTSRPLEYHI